MQKLAQQIAEKEQDQMLIEKYRKLDSVKIT